MLLQEEIAFLIDERRDKEVEDIFNKMGVLQLIRYDGHDICEQTNQEVLSKFNVVQILRFKCCSNKYNHRHGEGMQLLPHHTVNGQGLANCHIALGWAELPRKFLLFLGRVRGSVFSGFSFTV